MRNLWHSKTLFMMWNKYYWAKKHEHCVVCWTVKYKHRCRWMCTSCYAKEKRKTPNAQKSNKISRNKINYRNRVLKYLEQKEKKVRPRTRNQYEYNKKRRNEFKIEYRLIEKARRRRKKWLPCLSMIINWKTKYFPFEWIDKPKCTTSDGREEYYKRLKEFQILKDYYEWKHLKNL